MVIIITHSGRYYVDIYFGEVFSMILLCIFDNFKARPIIAPRPNPNSKVTYTL